MAGHPNIDKRKVPFEPEPQSGLPFNTLVTIAKELKIIQVMAEREESSITIDYLPGLAEQAVVRPADKQDAPAIETAKVEPIKVTYILEDAMFGGDVYFVLSADGKPLCRPTLWEGYDNLARYVLGGHK